MRIFPHRKGRFRLFGFPFAIAFTVVWGFGGFNAFHSHQSQYGFKISAHNHSVDCGTQEVVCELSTAHVAGYKPAAAFRAFFIVPVFSNRVFLNATIYFQNFDNTNLKRGPPSA